MICAGGSFASWASYEAWNVPKASDCGVYQYAFLAYMLIEETLWCFLFARLVKYNTDVWVWDLNSLMVAV